MKELRKEKRTEKVQDVGRCQNEKKEQQSNESKSIDDVSAQSFSF